MTRRTRRRIVVIAVGIVVLGLGLLRIAHDLTADPDVRYIDPIVLGILVFSLAVVANRRSRDFVRGRPRAVRVVGVAIGIAGLAVGILAAVTGWVTPKIGIWIVLGASLLGYMVYGFAARPKPDKTLAALTRWTNE